MHPDAPQKISLPLLVTVLVCNVVKVLALCGMLWASPKAFRPLVIIGDAVKSFLREPENETRARGPISAMDVVAATKQRRRMPSAGLGATYETATRGWRPQAHAEAEDTVAERASETVNLCSLRRSIGTRSTAPGTDIGLTRLADS